MHFGISFIRPMDTQNAYKIYKNSGQNKARTKQKKKKKRKRAHIHTFLICAKMWIMHFAVNSAFVCESCFSSTIRCFFNDSLLLLKNQKYLAISKKMPTSLIITIIYKMEQNVRKKCIPKRHTNEIQTKQKKKPNQLHGSHGNWNANS